MRLYLLLLIFLSACGLTHGQSGFIIDAAVLPNPLDPNGDGWITTTGAAFTGPLDETEFELPFVAIPEYEQEPVPDNQVPSTSCTKFELVGDAVNGAASTYYYWQDPDGIPDNGDERLFFRFRVARLQSNTVGLSILLDTDNKFGFSVPDADPNAIVGNPGFELEISVLTSTGEQIEVRNVDGVSSAGSLLSSYSVDTNLQVANALNQDTDCSIRVPGFIDLYVPFTALGISSTAQVRMVGAANESTRSALGGNASDIAGVDGTVILTDDDQFIAVIASYPPFSFQPTPGNDVPAATDATVSLNENSSNGTAVHTVSASDPDGDALTYNITSGNTSTAFAINSSGQITVNNASALDFEITTSFNLTVRVSDASLYDDAVITVNLNNVNEAPAATDATVSVNENSSNGTAVHTVSVTDPDGNALTYTITAGNTSTAFAINGSGQIAVSNTSALDFETTPSFNLTVRVSDGSLYDDAVITVNLNNVNEVPTATDATVSLNENSSNGTVVHTVFASDPDGNALTYTITAGNTSTAFAINGSGQITVSNASALNFETTPSFTLIIRASDGTLYDDAVITVNLNNVNEVPAATDATVSLNENASNGTAVHTVFASDPDGNALTYTITAGNTSTAFAINSSGQITVSNASALDFETTPSFTLTIRASDGTLYDDAVITVNLNNVNEVPAATDATVSLNENASNGTAVHTVSASDPDGNALTYAITAGNTSTAFAINSSGQITVSNASALDFETTPSFNLTVRVSDGTLYDDAVITVNLNDVYETPAVVNMGPVASDATVTLDENSPNGTVVHNLSASDQEGDVLTYSIIGGNTATAFAINSSGQIAVSNTATLNFETTSAFSLTVRVSDGILYDDALIVINLVDINETPQLADATIRIATDVAQGTIVHQFISDDPDVDDIAVFSIVSGNANSAFMIDENSGEIIVNEIGRTALPASLVYELIVMVADGGGLSATARLTITLEVGENVIDPLKGFSPNGDGDNDFWLIRGIEAFPDNEVKVFNRWGNLVFETRSYDNNQIAWRGTTGNDIPETTFFFLISVRGLQPITGYVIMKN